MPINRGSYPNAIVSVNRSINQGVWFTLPASENLHPAQQKPVSNCTY
jgi:hypothetical protein